MIEAAHGKPLKKTAIMLASAAALLLGAARPAFEVTLANFERGFPVASSTSPGFLPGNARLAAVLSDPGRSRSQFARFFLTASGSSAYLQHGPRGRYLKTGTRVYEAGKANCLGFRVRVPAKSRLLSRVPERIAAPVSDPEPETRATV